MRRRLLLVALCLAVAPPQCKRRREGPPPPAPPPITSLDACDARGDSPVEQALNLADGELSAGNPEAARAAVAKTRSQAGGDPFLLLRAGALLSRLGDAKGAAEVYQAAEAAALRIPEPQIARLYQAAAKVRLGDAAGGLALGDQVKAVPGALGTYACRTIAVAMALADAGQGRAAVALLTSVRGAAPKARSVHNALVDIAVRSGDEAAADDALAAACAALPEAPEFAVRRIDRLRATGKRAEAIAEAERLLLSGTTEPSLLNGITSLLTAPEVAKEAGARFATLAEQHPELPALALAAGVVEHGLKRYDKSSAWIRRCGALLDKDPRPALYLAQNELALHHAKEAAAEVARAARVAPDEPAVLRLRAVIELPSDPAAAARDLRRYGQRVAGHSNAPRDNAEDLAQTIALLDRCAAATGGPSAAAACVDHDVVRNGKALALREEYPGIHPDLPDGGTPSGDGGPRPDGSSPIGF